MAYNLGDTDLEILYDANTQVTQLFVPDEIEEYPSNAGRFPPHWKPFAELCRVNSWEKNLGILKFFGFIHFFRSWPRYDLI